MFLSSNCLYAYFLYCDIAMITVVSPLSALEMMISLLHANKVP